MMSILPKFSAREAWTTAISASVMGVSVLVVPLLEMGGGCDVWAVVQVVIKVISPALCLMSKCETEC